MIKLPTEQRRRRATDTMLDIAVMRKLHPGCRTSLPYGLSNRVSFGDFGTPKTKKYGQCVKRVKRRVSLPSVLGTGGRAT